MPLDSQSERYPPPDPAELGLSPGEDLWVFGYGSLMWNPGFAYAEARPALLRGFHRRFCIYSHHYRGTAERPGLVLGLDRGGSCRGLAFRVQSDKIPEALAYLWGREMLNGVYAPTMLPLRLMGGETVRACAFVARPGHRHYCADRNPEALAAFIRQGIGERGPNREYLVNTVQHLRELGIRDVPLERLMDLVCEEN